MRWSPPFTGWHKPLAEQQRCLMSIKFLGRPVIGIWDGERQEGRLEAFAGASPKIGRKFFALAPPQIGKKQNPGLDHNGSLPPVVRQGPLCDRLKVLAFDQSPRQTVTIVICRPKSHVTKNDKPKSAWTSEDPSVEDHTGCYAVMSFRATCSSCSVSATCSFSRRRRRRWMHKIG